MITKAKGSDRTMKEYALQAGMGTSSLSMIVSGKRKASIKNFQVLTSDAAKPRNGVTFEELVSAAGFVSIVNNPLSDVVFLTESDEDADIEQRFNHQKELEIISSGVIQRVLSTKGYIFEVTTPRTKWYSPSLAIELKEADKGWWFDVNTFINVEEELLMPKLQQILTRLLTAQPDFNRTITVIVDIEEAYDKLEALAGELAYKGDLSVAYLNRQYMRFEKEKYLSCYGDDSNQKLFLI
ncbi:hypothetical protein [Anaerosporobacter sp.]|uniref:hypothetical protein n=1 Tax=Anaerosporobacter sp. TaxID=1872529 RepID=UPI00286F28CB|nr:hypothetical protein [Anaerosporobacter sp.]